MNDVTLLKLLHNSMILLLAMLLSRKKYYTLGAIYILRNTAGGRGSAIYYEVLCWGGGVSQVLRNIFSGQG